MILTPNQAASVGHASVAAFGSTVASWFQGFALRELSPILIPLQGAAQLPEGADHGNAHDLPFSLSDEEMRRLESLGKREGLTVEQMVRLSVCDFIGQPNDTFRAAARRVMEENVTLYRRLS